MDLLDRYLRAVKSHLPAEQQDDILRELADHLRSQIEDRESALGRPLTEPEQEALLKAHGHPLLVAGRYRADTRSVSFGRQLIGPVLFPFYLRILALNVGITLAIGIVAAIALAGRQPTFEVIPHILGNLLLQFAIVTLIFSLVERQLTRHPDRWDPRKPDTFPVAPHDPTRVPRSTSIAELVALTLFVSWWLAVPRYLDWALGSAAAFLQPGPGLRALYLPILLISLAGIVPAAITLVLPGWVRFRSAARITLTSLFLLALFLSFRAGAWFTGDAAHQHAAGLINHWVGISLLVTAGGCVLQVLWDVWKLTRYRPDGALVQAF
jgi:hypothetical protein